MTSFIKIQPHIEVKVPDYFTDEREVDVQIHLSVSDDGFLYWGPMDCSGSIHKNQTMMQLQHYFIKNYENQGYKYVRVINVFIDKEFLAEYKTYGKNGEQRSIKKAYAVREYAIKKMMCMEYKTWLATRPKHIQTLAKKYPPGCYLIAEGAPYAISCPGTKVYLTSYLEDGDVTVVVRAADKTPEALDHERILCERYNRNFKKLSKSDVTVRVDPKWLLRYQEMTE